MFSWQEICQEVKRTVSGSLFEFKERIKALIKVKLSQEVLEQVKAIK